MVPTVPQPAGRVLRHYGPLCGGNLTRLTACGSCESWPFLRGIGWRASKGIDTGSTAFA